VSLINPCPPNAAAVRHDLPVVCVQGLGFVGAAMATAVAMARDPRGAPCHTVVGIDLNTTAGRQRIEAVERGEFPFATLDDSLVAATRRARADGLLRASSDPAWYALADVIVVDVHLDVIDTGPQPSVDFESLRAAVRTVADRMKPGALLIVETTVPPGTCEKVVAPELAAAWSRRGLPEQSFLLAHSYERVMPGADYLASVSNFWRVYAGHTPAAADACEAFLRKVINVADFPLTRLGCTTASEMAKVMENSYRAVNIAFIEEWARLAEAVGADLFEIIAAIRMRPTHNNIRQPGFGVGGYCLTKDPLFPGIAARQLLAQPALDFPFCERAVRVNAAMPMVTVQRLRTALGGQLAGRRVLLLGVTYRQDVADTRFSPAQTFAEAVLAEGAQLEAHDPLVGFWDEMAMTLAADLPPAAGLDAVVLAIPHRAYRGLDFAAWLGQSRPLVIDANAVLDDVQRRAVKNAGCRLLEIGKG
jgi:UDP-N-acetyl-D-glucosamine dehydrogenase